MYQDARCGVDGDGDDDGGADADGLDDGDIDVKGH